MANFWAIIEELPPKQPCEVFSGQYDPTVPQRCICPNCNADMFPSISYSQSVAAGWNSLFYSAGFLTLYVCVECALHLSNYSVRYERSRRIVNGGYRNAPAYRKIDTPFQSRAVKLVCIEKDFWTDGVRIEEYAERLLLNGIYHQIGGQPLRKPRQPLEQCSHCSELVQFFGVIDYDDQNVPLYEDGRPLALDIGDLNCLNVYLCNFCATAHYCIAE